MKSFFFITTDHLETRIWFRDDEDFKVGMNYLAVTAAKTGVTVAAFILMSNHVHILLYCCRADALHFINLFKQLYGTHYRNKYGDSRFFRRNSVAIDEIDSEDEGLEKVIAYIVMNSVAARICANANGYRWGTGACYFNDNKEVGHPVREMSGRSRIKLFRSRAKIPDSWTVGAGGYILPECYVAVKGVENIFKTPSRYNYFLNASSKAKKARDASGPAFRDQVVLECINDLCVTMFNKKSPSDLNKEEKKELVKQLRWRLSTEVHQISRVSGIKYAEVTEMINSL